MVLQNPNLLPSDMRRKEQKMVQKGRDSSGRVKMHLPEVQPVRKLSSQPKPLPPIIPTPSAKNKLDQPLPPPKPTKAKHSRPYKVLLQSQEVIKEKTSPFRFWKKDKKPSASDAMNLIAPDARTITWENFWLNLTQVVGSLVVLVIVFGLAYGSIKFYQIKLMADISAIDQDITLIREEVNSYKSDQNNFIKLQLRAEALQLLLKDHIHWTKFLDQLAEHTLPDVFYTNLITDYESGVSLEAYAPSYEQLAAQLFVLQNATDFISRAEVLSASQVEFNENPMVVFNISVELTPDFLKYHGPNRQN